MNNTQEKWFERLKEMAEQAVKNQSVDVKNIDSADITKLINDIQVFQAELEIQNDELRTSLDELEKSRTRFSRLFDMAPAGYIILDESGIVLDVNQTMMDMLHKHRDDLMRKPFSRFIAPDDQGIFLARFTAFYKNPADKTMEIRLIKGSNSMFHARLAARFIPLETYPGKPDIDQFCLIVTDITETKQAEARILHLEKAESLGRLAGAVAHHYNNLLTVVMGNLDMALIDLPEDCEPAASLTQAMEAARRASKLGSMMLAYLGQTNAPRKRLDLSRTCKGFLSALQADMPSHIILEADLQETGPAVTANARQIQQILEFLVTNAWEAMGDKTGSVYLGMRRVCSTEIATAHRYPMDFQPDKTDYACIEVTDTGPGIPENDIDKIFEPFYSTKFTGRGLGLPVALGAVKTHSGCMTVATRPGRGTRIMFFLPVTDKTDQALPDKRETDEM